LKTQIIVVKSHTAMNETAVINNHIPPTCLQTYMDNLKIGIIQRTQMNNI